MNIIVYGAGKRTKRLCELIQYVDAEIVSITDSNSALWGQIIDGYTIIEPSQCSDLNYDCWLISVANANIYKEIKISIAEHKWLKLEREISYTSFITTIMTEIYLKNKTRYCSKVKDRENTVIFDCYNGMGLGGIEAWSQSLSQEFLENNIHTRILTDDGEYELVADILEITDKVIVGQDKWSLENFERVAYYFSQFENCTIITSQPNLVLLAAGVVKQHTDNNVKIITVIHNGTQETYEQYLEFDDIVDYFVGVSEDIANGMINIGVAADKIKSTTLPFACQENLVRKYTNDCYEPLHIGYAGRLEIAQKRMDLLLKLIDELMNRNIMFRMEIAGEGSEQRYIAKYIEENNLQDSVIMLGRISREDIPGFWQNQDIAVNISDYEGHSISQMEAMGNGAVPVVTKVSGVMEDIEYGVTGYYVDLEDYKAMADIIEYLYNHRNKLASTGRNAHCKMYEKSKMDDHIKFWRNIL